ncbi:MAG: phytoene desaturase family protein [Gammaproteobacteria bacterium]
MKKFSSGALTREQKALQDENYRDRHAAGVEYDYLVIGTGNAALTCASLLSNQGYKVCMLEAHDVPGGYAHTFERNGYYFCAQVHYIWGCGEGGRIYEFLKRLGLEKDITFELFDKSGYDHMIMPDGKRVKIPYGWAELQKNIEDAYPHTTGLDAFFKIVKALRKEMAALPRKIHWWDYLLKGRLYFPTLLRYKNATVQDVFDACGVSIEAQTILTAQAGDLLLPPDKLSLLYYIGVLGGYGTGAYSPTKHFKYYIQRLAKFVTDHGGDLYFEERVTEISTNNGSISGVTTATGKTFTARNYICGMDPQKSAELIGWQHFPKRHQDKLKYEYSDNGIMVYLGLKPGFDPARYGLGNHNTWHCLDWGMNTMWEAGKKLDVEHAWFFMSTPTMHSNDSGSVVPDGGHIIELATFAPYAPFKQAADQDYKDYLGLKKGIAEKLIDLAAKYHIPDLKDHIAVKVAASPTTSEDFCNSPHGNAYGAAMLPKYTVSRLNADTPFANLYWCNASSGIPGIYGTVTTGMELYMDLTGDYFYQQAAAPQEV